MFYLYDFSLQNSWRRKFLQSFFHSSCHFSCEEWELFPKKKKNVILKLPFGRGFTLSVHLLFIISVNTCQASSFTVLGWKKRSKTNSYSLSLPSDLCIFLISRTTWQNTYLNLIFTDDKKIWEGKNMLHIHITRTTDRGRTNQPLPLSD